ncbi:MAG: helix-turn-helix transcriptional regulator [Clostridia bacterium]|nr:helix-turn-helix transcriptional regulator [Clostridia bacterium]
MSETLKEIGTRICLRRREVGLTQEKLAEKMDVSVQMISNLERGNKAIRIDNLIKLCEILNISSDYILTGVRSQSDLCSVAQELQHLSEDDKRLAELIIKRLKNG